MKTFKQVMSARPVQATMFAFNVVAILVYAYMLAHGFLPAVMIVLIALTAISALACAFNFSQGVK